MLYSIKALIVVLVIAGTIFHLGRSIALKFISEEDFSRRRLVWFVLTAAAFLSPSFWLYLIVAVPALIWAYRRDSNPIALYLFMLHVIPEINIRIPVLGNNGLFNLDNYRVLAFCVLLPAAIRHRKKPKERGASGAFGIMDILLLASGALDIALYVAPDLPNHYYIPDSPTNMLRRAFLWLLDTYVLFYTLTRTCQSRRRLVDAAASFCLVSAVMAGIAMFEQLRGWLLYFDLGPRWGDVGTAGMYLMRGQWLRAQASAGHSLALGYLLAIASGLWLYLQSHVQSRVHRIGVTLLLWGGLIASYSRGPWLGTVVIYFAFKAAGPRAFSRLVKGTLIALAVGTLVAMSPIGDRILDVLPVMGRAADNNIVYRQRLAERGWDLVLAHPFFGDQFPWPEMEDLRQGEGIIDIVNTYLGVALTHGFVGLFCFLSFIFIATARAYARSKESYRSDPDLALLGASLVGCIAGALVMLESTSFIIGAAKMFYVLAGLAVVYARLSAPPQPRSAVVSAKKLAQERS